MGIKSITVGIVIWAKSVNNKIKLKGKDGCS